MTEFMRERLNCERIDSKRIDSKRIDSKKIDSKRIDWVTMSTGRKGHSFWGILPTGIGVG